MQPYFVPYLGYWQLLNSVDRFVIYDDVAYTQGWINRNRILINHKASYISVPLSRKTLNRRIRDILIYESPVWQRKMVKSIRNAYSRAPYFHDVYSVIEGIINYRSQSLSEFLINSIMTLTSFMKLQTKLIPTSSIYHNDYLKGQERVIDICKQEKASIYINAIGGRKLYDIDCFRRNNIDIYFIKMKSIQYKQRFPGFISNLSIVDMLMEIGPDGVKQNLENYILIR